ncbi:hypothetical protein C0989_006483 [Termitomyces sp. Mn162]|nr:hypothetical protein C0989_006483 [Termitomyces sp. Mn162]
MKPPEVALIVEPPWGGWREGASIACDKGKWRASSSLEAGPSKWVQGEQAMAGPPGPIVYSLTSRVPVEQSAEESWPVAKAFLQCWVEGLEQLLATCKEEAQRVGEDRDEAWRERDAVQRDRDIAMWTAIEQLLQLQELQAWMVPLEAWVEVAAQQAEGLSCVGVSRVLAEVARRQEEWLTNEVASGQRGILHKLALVSPQIMWLVTGLVFIVMGLYFFFTWTPFCLGGLLVTN